jgi:hypothetical protein
MNIPNTIPNFKNLHFLLFVAGKQELFVYEGKEGVIEEINHIKIKKPKYSDNEGHFKVRSEGKTIRSGSVRELDDEVVIGPFIKTSKEEFKKYKVPGLDAIFLTAPSTTKNRLADVFSIQQKRKLKNVIEGNFCSDSPLQILRKISPSPLPAELPRTSEAQKIIRKNNTARMVVKGKPNV